MRTNKEYPATHSMSTAWFAIDADGEVAIIDFDENGPVPNGLEESCIEDLIDRSMNDKDDFFVDFTDEQWDEIMSIAQPAEEFKTTNYEYVGGLIVEVDMSKFDLIEAAYKNYKENELVCLNERKHIYKIYLTCGWHRRSRVYDMMVKQVARVYKLIFTERAVIRYIDLDDFENKCVYDDVSKVDERSDNFVVLPFYLFQQPYSTDYLIKRTAIPQKPLKASQLSQRFIDKALRLPIKFSETEQLQIAEYIQSSTTYCLADEVLVYKGCRYKLLPRSNGELAYILYEHDGNLKESVPLVIMQNDLPEGSEIKKVEEL